MGGEAGGGGSRAAGTRKKKKKKNCVSAPASKKTSMWRRVRARPLPPRATPLHPIRRVAGGTSTPRLVVICERVTGRARQRGPKKDQGTCRRPVRTRFPFPTVARSPADADAASPIDHHQEVTVGVHTSRQSSWRERSTGRRACGGGAGGGKDGRPMRIDSPLFQSLPPQGASPSRRAQRTIVSVALF